jgi:pyrroloquinoline quinone biosynthesis protein D
MYGRSIAAPQARTLSTSIPICFFRNPMTDTPLHNLNSHPRLAAGVRLGQDNNQQVLLMPERALRLNGPSLEIVQRCDGKRTVREIVTELQHLYSKAEPAKVESDILGYLKLLQDQRALDFE